MKACLECGVIIAKARKRCIPCAEAFIIRKDRARLYGITHVEVEDLYRAHGGKCAACGDGNVRLNIDHDHITGRVRGLLCTGCNLAIGQVKENTKRLQLLIEYLERNY
jgi:hypothetical protein